MKTVLKIFLLTAFSIYSATSIAQSENIQDKTTEVKSKKPGSEADNKTISLNGDQDNQKPDGGKKKTTVKQVRSARPDMSRSRGARPPDIVRPSGSRIPKGVGRPAGAAMHGRG
jgi:hypothetical protein